MRPTVRLYFDDPWLLEFDARVVGHGELAGRPTVVLDRSAFYPEGGGQSADRGALGGAAVVDVQVDERGVVHHILDGALPAVDSELRGAVDRAHRRQNMAVHTGQHMLSRALLDVAGAATVSSRLGEGGCTIDLDAERVPERELAAAEALVNAVVDDDLEIRAYVPEPSELAALPLRREPKVEREVRVVRIGAFDVSPCGGTHCTRTAQVGLVRIAKVERYKGMQRVWFGAGPRARADVLGYAEQLRALGLEFTCGPEGVRDAVARQSAELRDARAQLRQLQLRQADSAADAAVADARARGDWRVVASVDGADPSVLKAIAQRVTREPELVCFLAAADGDGVHVFVARGARAGFDCGAFVKRVAAETGGRGGGRAEHAQGRLPPGVDWPALVPPADAA